MYSVCNNNFKKIGVINVGKLIYSVAFTLYKQMLIIAAVYNNIEIYEVSTLKKIFFF